MTTEKEALQKAIAISARAAQVKPEHTMKFFNVFWTEEGQGKPLKAALDNALRAVHGENVPLYREIAKQTFLEALESHTLTRSGRAGIALTVALAAAGIEPEQQKIGVKDLETQIERKYGNVSNRDVMSVLKTIMMPIDANSDLIRQTKERFWAEFNMLNLLG